MSIAIEDIADDHLHTNVSDGDLSPEEVLAFLSGRQRGPVAIADHDTLGVHKRPELRELAARLGVTLVPATEMDAWFQGVEMHVLGFGVDVDDQALNHFLDGVAALRRERAAQEIDIVNDLLGEGTFTAEQIFVEGRETLMKPHFIKPLLARGRFGSYREANAWYKANVKAATKVAKAPVERVIELIRGARGTAVLAHPGYYVKDHGMDLPRALAAMKEMGLEGVETDYPYHERSRSLFDPGAAREMVAQVAAAARGAGLRTSCGTDCHSLEDFQVSYPGVK